MTLFQTAARQSVPLKDETETKQDRVPEAITEDDQEAASESSSSQGKPAEQLSAGTTGKEKNVSLPLQIVKELATKGFGFRRV